MKKITLSQNKLQLYKSTVADVTPYGPVAPVGTAKEVSRKGATGCDGPHGGDGLPPVQNPPPPPKVTWDGSWACLFISTMDPSYCITMM